MNISIPIFQQLPTFREEFQILLTKKHQNFKEFLHHHDSRIPEAQHMKSPKTESFVPHRHHQH